MPFSPRLGQEVGMRFFGDLVRAIFRGRNGGPPSAFRLTPEDILRQKIHHWQHQAILYEIAGRLRIARRCRDIANSYRTKLVALVFKDEVA
jgi:hypothetical protein